MSQSEQLQRFAYETGRTFPTAAGVADGAAVNGHAYGDERVARAEHGGDIDDDTIYRAALDADAEAAVAGLMDAFDGLEYRGTEHGKHHLAGDDTDIFIADGDDRSIVNAYTPAFRGGTYERARRAAGS